MRKRENVPSINNGKLLSLLMGVISYSKFLWDLLREPVIFSFHDLISPQFDENCKLRLFY